MLAGMLREAGCDVVDYGTVADDEAALESVLRAAGERVAIVTSGGVSMGEYDVVKAVLGRIADMTWMQIAIKPAKPFAFGMERQPIFGLPGNLVSSIVSFEMLARPALRRMMGHRRLAWPITSAISDDGVNRRPDGRFTSCASPPPSRTTAAAMRSVGAQGSHQPLPRLSNARSPSCPTVTASRPGRSRRRDDGRIVARRLWT